MTAPRAALPRAGLGPYAESFIRLNETVLSALGAHLKVFASSNGAVVRVVPGARVGAVPSRSAQTGHVAGGFIVKPHFDWAGMGRVLVETRWATSPELLDLPLVPGSGREVPPGSWPVRCWPGSRPWYARSNGATGRKGPSLATRGGGSSGRATSGSPWVRRPGLLHEAIHHGIEAFA